MTPDTATTSPATGAMGLGLPDAWRIETFKRPEFEDPDGTHAEQAIAELGIDVTPTVRLGRGFLMPPDLARSEVDRIVNELLQDPVLDEVRVMAPGAEPGAVPQHRILVAKKPGVMDPVAQTIARAIQRNGLLNEADAAPLVMTFSAWELTGDLDQEAMALIARRVLANPVIDNVSVTGEGLFYGHLPGHPDGEVISIPLEGLDEAALLDISTSGGLSLNAVEMRAIQDHYITVGRAPTAAELETVAQTWSEHCKHKTFKGRIEMDGEVIDDLLKSTIVAATFELDRDWCISVFHDNAGIIEFDQGWDVAFKVETHNHPSAIDPYGGAGTGIGGVIRDILGVGLGARPIANSDAFFVGHMDTPREDLPRGTMHPKRILRGVVAGVRDYGNRMGIPTISGGVWFHEGYLGNPLVYAGTVGILPRDCATKSVAAGDKIVVVGGRTGRDGIHGATFSSVELTEDSEVTSATAVQIGDPITEKRVLDGLLQARDQRLYRGVTDCGAGGLSSAVGEMGEDTGAEVDLDLVPLKYPGLTPEEIWISEAQERMVLSVPPEKVEACLAVFRDEDVEATVIGSFTDTGRLVLRYKGTTVGDMSMEFLHDGTPRPTRQASWTPPGHPDPGCPMADDMSASIVSLLGRPNIASKEWIVRQYDHEVQGMSVIKPLSGVRADAPSDGTVIRPLAESKMGLALGCGANPRYGALDPGAMAEAVIDEALRNVVCTYGDPDHTAILDNFSWGNCDRPEQLGALVHAARGCQRAAVAYGTPFISGKDSLNNEYRHGDQTLAIPPTLFVSALARVPNVARAVTMGAKRAGNLLLLVGTTKPELGGSEYLAQLGLDGGRVPRPDLEHAPLLFRKLHSAMKLGYLHACHDLSEGGLAVAAAEMCLAGELGVDIDLTAVDVPELPQGYDRDATLLFSESCTRFLVEVEPGKKFNLQTKLLGVAVTPLGRFQKHGHMRIKGSDGRPLTNIPLDDLRTAQQSGFQG